MPLQRDSPLVGGGLEPLVDRRYGRQEGRGALPGDGEHEVRIELREEHEPGAHAHREGETQRESISVEHGKHRVDHAAFAARDGRHPGTGLRRVHGEVEVSEGGALGAAGGAAGVLDKCNVRRVRAHDLGFDRRRLQQLLPHDGAANVGGQRFSRVAGLAYRQSEQRPRGERHRARDIHRDDGVDRHIGREGLDRADDVVPRDDDLRRVVFKLVAKLTRGVQRVVLDDYRADPQHGIERDDVLRTVRQHESDGVALLHAQQAKALGSPLDLQAHLGVGGHATEELERRVAREFGDGCLDQVVQRTPGQFQLDRNPVGV